MTTFDEAVQLFGVEASAKLRGPGQREALIRTPIDAFLRRCGDVLGLSVQPHDEVSEAEGTVRPDYAIDVGGAITGYVEVKAPSVPVNPELYGRSSHNHKQWQKLRELPNLIYTNGIEWRLWQNGEPVGPPVHMQGPSDLAMARSNLKPGPGFERLITEFLRWKPADINSVNRLVETIAPLTRLLKEQVQDRITQERKLKKTNASTESLVFLGLRADWRRMLFPGATDDQFSDGYAQTVTFALLLAQAEGVNLDRGDLHQIGAKLRGSHSLMGRTLQLLTDQLDSGFLSGLDLLIRVIGSVNWNRVESGRGDVYLHLYEHFLQIYDVDSRKKTGSYYTPVEVVTEMVRLTEEVLHLHLGRSRGFRDPRVHTVDPAMGTGTFPLAIMKRVAEQAAAEYGDGAAPEGLANLMERLYGFELQSGPFSVAELRISGLMKEFGAKLPDKGLQLFVANTLSDPKSVQPDLSSTLQVIAEQSYRANQIKRETNVQVIIGNPPYRERAAGMGDWVESGGGAKEYPAIMQDFKEKGKGSTEFNLKNLYIYFWRWAFWKSWESTQELEEVEGDSGVVSFITAQGYLTGDGFAGMRRYIRKKARLGWIINLTPEGKRPPQKNAIFSIETPVGIGIYLRDRDTDEAVPADIKYIELSGTRDEKFQKLAELSLTSDGWQSARTGWTAPFTAQANSLWDDYPSMSDLFPWYSTGAAMNRTWVYAPTREVLENRWRELTLEGNPERKQDLLKKSRDSNLNKVKKPLPKVRSEIDVMMPLKAEFTTASPAIERVAYRSFDRQWVIADYRVLDMPRPDLWAARQPGQIFISEQHSQAFSGGPGLSFSSLIPDVDHFNLRGGRTLPLLHPNGEFNVTKGLLQSLSGVLGMQITGDDLLDYVAGVSGHPGFTAHFATELRTPGIRIPLTSDPALWLRAVDLGHRVVDLHTYGGRSGNGGTSLIRETGDPEYKVTVSEMPDGFRYDSSAQILYVGESGEWHGVSPAIAEYSVGQKNIVSMWFKYRVKKPITRGGTELDGIVQEHWPAEWSRELSELLIVLGRLVKMEPDQQQLLDCVMAGDLLPKDKLTAEGVEWPDQKYRPQFPMTEPDHEQVF
ncbi:type ISP restriction/modification enzyme [Arthrobacter sp. TMT4-20]